MIDRFYLLYVAHTTIIILFKITSIFFIINSDVLGTRNDGMGHPYTVFARRKDNKDLIQCLTPGCDGMGHSTGNYSTHRRYY